MQYRAFMGETGFEDRVGCFSGGVADLPDANSMIDTAGHEPFAVGTEGDGVLVLERLRKRVAPFAARDVPLPHLAKPARLTSGGEKEFVIRRKCNRVHAATMPLERADRRVGFRR